MTSHAYNPSTTFGRLSQEDRKFKVNIMMCQKRRGKGGRACRPVVSELVRSEAFGGPRSTIAKQCGSQSNDVQGIAQSVRYKRKKIWEELSTEGEASEEDKKCLLWEGTGGQGTSQKQHGHVVSQAAKVTHGTSTGKVLGDR